MQGLYIARSIYTSYSFIIAENFKSVAVEFPVVLMDLLLKKNGCVNELCTFSQVWSKLLLHACIPPQNYKLVRSYMLGIAASAI